MKLGMVGMVLNCTPNHSVVAITLDYEASVGVME